MAFKTIYPPVGSAQRISTGVDTAPARGTIILTGGGTGAQPDFFSKEYHRARIAFRFTDGAGAEVPTGTCDIDIWYRDIVEEAGNSDLLLQVFTNEVGHANFTAEQFVLTVEAMKDWLDTGTRPDIPDSAAFPVADGFIENFVIPEWPF